MHDNKRNNHDARYIDGLVALVLVAFALGIFEFTTKIHIASPMIGIPAQTVQW